MTDAQGTAALLQSALRAASTLREGTAASKLRLIAKLVERIELTTEEITVRIDASTLVRALGFNAPASKRVRLIVLRCPATKVWHGRQLRLVIPGPAGETGLRLRSPALIRLIGEAQEARQLVLANPNQSVSAIARNAGRCRTRLKFLLRLACLSPAIVTAILEGRQPLGPSNAKLLNSPLPLDWNEQRTLLGSA